jgi:hypothetical protein
MKKWFLLFGMVLLLSTPTYGAPVQAITNEGRVVILRQNGTWIYQERSQDARTVVLYPDGTWTYHAPAQEAWVAAAIHSKPVSSTTVVKGETVPYGIWFNENTWRPSGRGSDDVIERRFTHVSGEAWGAVIAENTRLTVEFVKDFVLESAKRHMPDATIRAQETRLVNGHEVLFLRIEGQYHSSPRTYLSYHYIGDAGTVQMYTWTSKQFADKYASDMIALLDGFEINPEQSR